MEKSLSDEDISKSIPNVISYQELQGVNPDKLLRNLPVAILYMNAPNRGHWTLLHETPEGIEFFDSYGYKPDTEFKMIGAGYQQPRYLAELLVSLAEKIPIHYNQYQFQEMKPGVNTCGRWVILRNNYSKIGIDKFKKAIDIVARDTGLTPDQLAVKLTTS